MAEQSSHPSPHRRVRIKFLPWPRGERLPDAEDPLLDANDPVPRWAIVMTEGADTTLGTWELWHPGDFPSKLGQKLVSIEREVEALETDAYMGRVRDQIRILLPDLPEDVFDLLSHRQLLAIATNAYRRPGETRKEATERKADAANPPAGERASDSPSRSPHDSFVGVMPS